MSTRDEILESLGIAPAAPASAWLKDNGWTFWTEPCDRRWHFMRAAGGVLRSLCGRTTAPAGTDLCESGGASSQACRACLDKLAAERLQPELAL